MSQKQVTIYDIAREAGVSASTVSRILTGSTGVKQDKRERVMELVEKYQFRPNAMAKGLSLTHSRLIGMLCADVRNPYYSNLFVECEHAAYEAGYTLMLNNTFARPELEIGFMNKFLEQRVEALIISGGVADWRPMPENYVRALSSCAKRVPVIVAGEIPIKNVHQIRLDHVSSTRQVVQHLLSLGHKRIAFLHGYSYVYQTHVKLATFREMMEEHNLPVREEYLVDAGSFDEFSGFDGMNRLLALPQPPTAVITTNDMMALGALNAITRLGYAVPRDFSLVSFDNIYLTDLTQPRISSVALDYADYGRRLIESAVRAIEGKPVQETELLSMPLVIKDSCRKID